jgi:hypothetical protein
MFQVCYGYVMLWVSLFYGRDLLNETLMKCYGYVMLWVSLFYGRDLLNETLMKC